MRSVRLAVVVILGLAGCGERNATDAAPEALAVSAEAPPPGKAAPAADAAPATVALPQIAYAYDFTLELPSAAVVPLFERHRRAC